MNKKNVIIIGSIIIILIIIGIILSQTMQEEKNIENKTITNNTTLNTTNNQTIEKNKVDSDDNSNSHNGWKYKDGVWYDPNDPSTWYDSEGNWEKMESDLTKDFLYENSGPNDKYYNSHGQEISKEEYFNDPTTEW